MFARLLLDSQFDSLADTAVIANLRNGSSSKKVAATSILSAVGAYVDTHMRDDTPLRRFFSSIAVDAFPEIGSRIMREPHRRANDKWRVAELSPDQLEEFLDIWEHADPATRSTYRDFVKRRTTFQLIRLLGLPPKTRMRLMAYATERTPLIPQRITFIDRMIEQMNKPLFS